MPDANFELTTCSVKDTRALGRALASRLRAGDVVALSGDLGTGKTALVQGASAALGVTLPVTSPTFVLVKHLPAPVPVVHVDVYRLEHLAHLDDLDEDVFAPQVITFVEWAERIGHLLPDDRLDVHLVRGDVEEAAELPDDAPRYVSVVARGPGWAPRAEALEHAVVGWRAPAEDARRS